MGTIHVLNTPRTALTQQLTELGFAVFEGTHDYLTTLPIHSLTKEHAERLKKEKERAEQQLADLEATSPGALWLADLQ